MTSTPAPDTAQHLKSAMHELERSLLERMEALEQENERLRRFGTYLLVGTGVLLGIAAAVAIVSAERGFPSRVAEKVQAREYVLRGPEGEVRGVWGVDREGGLRLVLQDSAGRAGITLTLLPTGAPGAFFSDRSGHPRAVLGILPDETTTLTLADRNGVTRTVLGLQPDGSSTLVFADRTGTTRAGLGVDARGYGTFSVAERPGQAIEQPPDTAAPPADSVRSDTAARPAKKPPARRQP